MTWAVLSINNKGGTGKSTIAVETAYKLRDKGHDVGLMDADIDSANLASRLGCDKKVKFKGDHTIEPVEHDGMKLYSMENAFQESTFSQSGEFMRNVINNMVNHSDWGDLDYMVVDCPPGSSDVFGELVRALRPSILGAISVGQPDAVDDTARLVKVCNHNWVPIIGFIENMSGIVCHGETVTCNDEGHDVEPFGSGTIEKLVKQMSGNYLGDVPLCVDGTEISDVASDTLENTVDDIEESEQPELPEDNIGQKSFIKNVWKTVKSALGQVNNEYDIDSIQNKFGVEGRDPLNIKLEITDAGPISGLFSEVVISVQNGDFKVMRVSKAKRNGISPEAEMKINSQDLYDSMRGKKKMMRSVTGEVTTEPYSITKAVQMGDASISGERTINRLSALDRILSEEVDMEKVRRTVES